MQIKTENKQCEISLFVNSRDGDKIIAYDKSKPNTIFYERVLTGRVNNLIIKLPISPEILTIELYNNGVLNKNVISNVSVNDLQKSNFYIDNLTKKYIDFVKIFCLKAGYLQPKIYVDRFNQFTLNYQLKIKDRGVEAYTPARIGVSNNVIQVSKTKMKNKTIPERMLILLHEYSHNFLNNDLDCEKEADYWGEQLYFSLGFPVISALKTFDNVLSNSELSQQRMKQVYENAEQYAIRNIQSTII